MTFKVGDRFELYENRRPWLHITPPVPEKRELHSYQYGEVYSVAFSSDGTFSYVGWGDLNSRGIVQSFTKKELKKFGQTLIRISEDMKELPS